jgi:hypothetical protein
MNTTNDNDAVNKAIGINLTEGRPINNFKEITDWCVVPMNASPFTPPECVEVSLHGKVTNHPRFPEGSPVTISRPVAYDAEYGIVQTSSGSIYQIGEPAADYAAQFPDAAERLRKCLRKLPPLRLTSEMLLGYSESDSVRIGTSEDYRANPHLIPDRAPKGWEVAETETPQ